MRSRIASIRGWPWTFSSRYGPPRAGSTTAPGPRSTSSPGRIPPPRSSSLPSSGACTPQGSGGGDQHDGVGLERAPKIAKDCGFEHVVAKLWWQNDELLAAEKANLDAVVDAVDAVCVGNEIIQKGIADHDRLVREVDEARNDSGVPSRRGSSRRTGTLPRPGDRGRRLLLPQRAPLAGGPAQRPADRGQLGQRGLPWHRRKRRASPTTG